MFFLFMYFFFFKQKTAYEMRISDWSSDVCSSDLPRAAAPIGIQASITAPTRADRLSPKEKSDAQDDLRQPPRRRRGKVHRLLRSDRIREERQVQQRAGIVDGVVRLDRRNDARQDVLRDLHAQTDRRHTGRATGRKSG